MARKKSKFTEKFDDSFYRLAKELTEVLDNNKDGTDQKTQADELFDAERQFKKAVLKYEKQSTEIYKKFLQKICIENRNILSARPYFRETATNFSKKVTPSIKQRDTTTLKTFDINFQFIEFIRNNWKGQFPKLAEIQYQRVFQARKLLIENNMPLAINRAKIFYRKTPKGHLSLLDMIGIASTGLTSGIDKFCGTYSRMFNGVIIGRIVGNLIDQYSETQLHFYPSDRRIIYKANSIRGRQKIDDVKELADAVNKSFKEDALEGKSIPKKEITEGELANLLNAANLLSTDSTVDNEGFGVYSYTIDENSNTEDICIEKETYMQMLNLIKTLPVLHQKVLRLKGIIV